MHFFCTERAFWVDIPRVHKILLENNVFRIINQFLFFGLSALIFRMFGELFNGWFVKTAFYWFRGHFWRKKIQKKIAQPPRAQKEVLEWNFCLESAPHLHAFQAINIAGVSREACR